MPKKIKVTITKKVNSFRYGDQVFKPGDTLEILPQYFRSDFMVKVVPPKAVEVLSEKFATEEVPKVPTEAPGEIVEAPGEGEKKKEKRRR